MPKDSVLKMVLEYDPTQDACFETGRDMADPDTVRLAFLKIHEDARIKRKILSDHNDTYRDMSLQNYLTVAKSIGFEVLYQTTLLKTNKDLFMILWHEASLLLVLDTYDQRMNNARLYFNWSGNSIQTCPPNGITGMWVAEPHIWAGSYHVLEGLKYHVNLLYQDNCKPLKKWVKAPSLYLFNWQDNHENCGDLTNKRIARFPDHVKKAIGFD